MEGVTFRSATLADAPGITRVHIESWRTTYRGIIPDAYLATMSYEHRQQNWLQRFGDFETPTYTYVAVDSTGRLVGFCGGGMEREGDPFYQSELYAIYLLEEVQRRGIGRRLMHMLAARLIQERMRSMLARVLAANPACQFYEALGGTIIRTIKIEIGGAKLAERIYGWQDISVFLQR